MSCFSLKVGPHECQGMVSWSFSRYVFPPLWLAQRMTLLWCSSLKARDCWWLALMNVRVWSVGHSLVIYALALTITNNDSLVALFFKGSTCHAVFWWLSRMSGYGRSVILSLCMPSTMTNTKNDSLVALFFKGFACHAFLLDIRHICPNFLAILFLSPSNGK